MSMIVRAMYQRYLVDIKVSTAPSAPDRWPEGKPVTLASYLSETGLELGDIYRSGRGWSAMCEDAGVPVAAAGPDEVALRRGIARMLHIDDPQRLATYRALLARDDRPDVDLLSDMERRLARMLAASVADRVVTKQMSLQASLDLLWSHPQVVAELQELLGALHDAPSHVQEHALPGIPLQVHSQYTRIEILAAVGEGAGVKTPQWREGVYDAKAAGADLLAFTLDKTSGDFSPTTRYRDYALSRELIHWESQSTTRAESPTGRRYRNHVAMGRSILLFARTRADDRAFWFLGPATYVRHDGEQPMAVMWRLAKPLPGDLYAAFAAAVA
jgi:hypothetical protein